MQQLSTTLTSSLPLYCFHPFTISNYSKLPLQVNTCQLELLLGNVIENFMKDFSSDSNITHLNIPCFSSHLNILLIQPRTPAWYGSRDYVQKELFEQ